MLGLPPVWYKSAPYRARAVIDPRGVLRELGLQLPVDREVRVWDSTAEIRYLVLPEQPAGTDGWAEERLAELVTRDAMIGVGLAMDPTAAMNGVHDLGGMHGFGPVAIERDEPVFHQEWEGRVFAMLVAVRMAGHWNIDQIAVRARADAAGRLPRRELLRALALRPRSGSSTSTDSSARREVAARIGRSGVTVQGSARRP